MRRPELVVGPVADLASEFARRFERLAGGAVRRRGRAAIVVPGGSVARAFFPALAEAAVDWSRVHVFWSDERAVPPDDVESNYGVARALWLEPARVPSAVVHRMPGDAADLAGAASAYAAEFAATAGDPPAPDVVLLGVGSDGHVASIFPGHRAIEESAHLALAIDDAPKAPARRLTLTLPSLAGARTLFIAAFGAEKREAVAAALDPPRAPGWPVSRIAARAARVVVLADPDAVTPPAGTASRRPPA
jgi:6-phosphogluconolactonase